jgi:hypothetical protein
MKETRHAEKIIAAMAAPGLNSISGDAFRLHYRLVSYLVAANNPRFVLGSRILNLENILDETRENNPRNNLEITQLFECGLLVYDSDGAVCCPALMPKTASTARAEASRNNGLKGGRPKKAQPETARAARQSAMILPIAGGKEKTQEGARVSETPSTTTYLSKSKGSEVSSTVFQETAAKVLEAMQIDPARSDLDCGLVRQWLADGATPELIVDLVTRKTGPHVKTLKYFNAAIAEAIAARPVATPQWEKKFNLDWQVWDVTGRIGPSPRVADYREQAA